MRSLIRRGSQQNQPGAIQPWTGGMQPMMSPMLSMLDDLRSEFDRFFTQAGDLLPAPTGLVSGLTAFMPPVDIQETNDEFRIQAEVPGIDPKEIDVRVEGQTLVISGERRQEHEEDIGNIHRSERSFGTFMRSFALPTSVKMDDVSAKFKNGVLTVRVPKAAEARPSRVQIQTEETPTQQIPTQTATSQATGQQGTGQQGTGQQGTSQQGTVGQQATMGQQGQSETRH